MSDPLGFFAIGADLSSEEEEEEEDSDKEVEEASARAAEGAASAVRFATAAQSEEEAITKGGNDRNGLLSISAASTLLETTDDHRAYLPPGKRPRIDPTTSARNSIFALAPDAEAEEAAVIGTSNARTLDMPLRTASYLLAANSAQLRAVELSSGARIRVHHEKRALGDRAPVKVTIAGDETALSEAERQLQEASATSARFTERVVFCKPAQAGAIIGKGGANIRRIQSHTGTHVAVTERSDSDAPRSVVVRGPPESVECAVRLLHACLRGGSEFEAAFGDGGGKGWAAAPAYGDAKEYALVASDTVVLGGEYQRGLMQAADGFVQSGDAAAAAAAAAVEGDGAGRILVAPEAAAT